MNAMGIIAGPMISQALNATGKANEQTSEAAQSLFSLLLQQGMGLKDVTEKKHPEMTEEGLTKLLASMHGDVEGFITSNSTLDLDSGIPNLRNMAPSMYELAKALEKHPEEIEIEQLLNEGISQHTDIPALLDEGISQHIDIPALLELNQVMPDLEQRIDIPILSQKLDEIFVKFVNLLSQVNDQQDIRQVAPKILELLKQWSTLESQLVQSLSSQESGTTDATNVKVNLVWKDILLAYQNRTKLNSRQVYQSDSQVTTKDVVKWIENALQNQNLMEKHASVQPSQAVSFHTNTEMPKLEQFVIFMNQNQSGSTAEKQLIDQFQQVIKTSKFLAMPNGANQLSIALRPQNLGEMMVRLTEVNGEMTVKIVVSTQVAKEMLESNIQQLRHMFSPQQVVIERQDIHSGQGQNATKQSDEQSLHNQEHDQSHSDEHESQEKGSKEDFEAHLDELIQSVKV